MLAAAKRQTLEATYGNYPAPLRLLDVVAAGYERGFQAGLDAERDALLELTETDALPEPDAPVLPQAGREEARDRGAERASPRR